jgi:biofilm PGA synthesis N-glycosyltransferase PgaC
MIAAFLLNIFLAWNRASEIYPVLFALQCIFYVSAYAGKIFEDRKIRMKLFFVPYYFCLMNYAVLAGIFRFVFGEQSVIWEKASRKQKAQ